jgi:hypothetical protein
MNYNSPRFYVDSIDVSIPRSAQVVEYAFELAASMFIYIVAAEFWTFGGNSRSYVQQLFTKRSLGDAESDGSLCIHTLDFSLGVYWRSGCLCGHFPRPTAPADNDFSEFFYDSLAYGIDHFCHLFDDLGLINALGGVAFCHVPLLCLSGAHVSRSGQTIALCLAQPRTRSTDCYGSDGVWYRIGTSGCP